jgi:hypothetical protein
MKVLAAVCAGVLVLLVVAGILFIFSPDLGGFLRSNDSSLNSPTLPATSPSSPDSPTIPPTEPSTPGNDMFEGTIWEIFELQAEGITVDKTALDIEGLIMTFHFKVHGEVTANLDGFIEDGTWWLVGNTLSIVINNEHVDATVDSNTFSLVVDDVFMVFKQT